MTERLHFFTFSLQGKFRLIIEELPFPHTEVACPGDCEWKGDVERFLDMIGG